MDKKIKAYFETKHENKQSLDMASTKKMFKYFIDKCDSYLPILIMGAGSNKYPLAFLKNGFDIRVIDSNKLLIEKYQNEIGDDGYYYNNMDFNEIGKKYEPQTFSGVWIDNSLIFNTHEQIINYLYTLYNILDDEAYIFIKMFVNLQPTKIENFEIESFSEFKLNKMLSKVNNLILEKENKDIYIDFSKKINDIIKLDLVKYAEVTDISSYKQPTRIASAIIRKKK